MQVYGAQIEIYCILCSKTYSAFIITHAPVHINDFTSGVCVQGMWNAQFKGQVTEMHRLKVNSYCDTALFISMYEITMMQP